MKIYIIEDSPNIVMPHSYYRKKCESYVMELEVKNNRHLWGLYTACNSMAMALYSQLTGRQAKVTQLVTTIEQAEELFEHFKVFANVWTYRIVN